MLEPRHQRNINCTYRKQLSKLFLIEVSRKKRTVAQYKGKVWYILNTKSGKKSIFFRGWRNITGQTPPNVQRTFLGKKSICESFLSIKDRFAKTILAARVNLRLTLALTSQQYMKNLNMQLVVDTSMIYMI